MDVKITGCVKRLVKYTWLLLRLDKIILVFLKHSVKIMMLLVVAVTVSPLMTLEMVW